MIKYILLIILVTITILFISNYIFITKINSEMNIQQSKHPNTKVISTMLNKKQPSIFIQEISLWDGIDLLIGYSYDNIKETFENNKVINKSLKNYLNPYSLPMSIDWNINLKTETNTWKKLPDYPIQETNYRHLVGNLSGLMMVCIISPNQTKLINKLKEKKVDFKLYLEENEKIKKKELKEKMNEQNSNDSENDSNNNSDNDSNKNSKKKYSDIDYITLPIRPSNLLYIPYKWYYYIYCGEENSYTCYLDMQNVTLF